MRKLWLLCALVCFGSTLFAASLSVVNPDFSAVAITCGGNYAYQSSGGDCSGPSVPQQDFNGAAGFGWTFNSGSGNGLTGPGTAFNPPTNLAFYQAAFLQGNANFVYQSVPGFVAGQEYQLSFYLGSRYASGAFDGNQTVQALLDGVAIGTWNLVSFTPFTLETVDFVATTGGSHTLEFAGLAAGDHTAFLTQTSIDPIPEPSTLLLLGSGFVGIGGWLRRKIG
jgi:hypothetical protein